MNPLDWLAGWKTYVMGVGLIGLGLYQFSQGDMQTATQSLIAGLGLIFARRATDRK